MPAMMISSQPPKTDVPHALRIYHPHFNMSSGFEIPTFIWRKQLPHVPHEAEVLDSPSLSQFAVEK